MGDEWTHRSPEALRRVPPPLFLRKATERKDRWYMPLPVRLLDPARAAQYQQNAREYKRLKEDGSMSPRS